ncbi:MAG TPA: TVP38/TMEM64 family protein [Candidatus Limnocylindrales bacterium]|nr:TVP38/TMEM64 family protein [Candidatus Limnocylindrales bacterium]
MQPQGKNRVWLKPLIFLATLALITYLLYTTGVFRFFMDKERLRRFLDSFGMWGFAGFIFLQAVQVVAAPIPGEATGLLGGYLYGPFLGVLLSTIGLTLGSYTAFALSRYFGRPLTDRFVDRATMERFDYLLHHKGAFLVFLLFLLPGFPKDYLCYILGLGHLATLEFLTIMASGRLLGTVLLTMGGAYLRKAQYFRFFTLCGVAVVAVFLAVAYKDKLEKLFRKWHVKHREKHPKK